MRGKNADFVAVERAGECYLRASDATVFRPGVSGARSQFFPFNVVAGRSSHGP